MNICIPLIGFKTDTIMYAYTHSESESNGCAYTDTHKHTYSVSDREHWTRQQQKEEKNRTILLSSSERTFVCLLACLYCASVTSESVSVCWCVRIWRSLEAMLSNTPTEPILMQYNWAKHRDACVFVLPQPLRLLLLSSIPHCYYYCSLPFIGFHLFGIATHKTSTHCEQFARNFLSRLLRVFVRAT